jgi:hypothetical protein
MSGSSKISEVDVTPHKRLGDMRCHSTSDAPSLRWRIAVLFCWCLRSHCTGVFAVLVLVSLPLLRCCLCLRCACGVIAFVALASPLLLRWHCCPYCGDIFALVALASLPVFSTGINRPHCADVFTVVLLALSSKAHIALVSLSLFHWFFHHGCVVCTNICARKIACIGAHVPFHPFTAIHDLVFNRSLDCDVMSQVGWVWLTKAATISSLTVNRWSAAGDVFVPVISCGTSVRIVLMYSIMVTITFPFAEKLKIIPR